MSRLAELPIPLLAALSTQCVSGPSIQNRPGRIPATALSLEIRLMPVEVSVGDRLTIELVLTNVSGKSGLLHGVRKTDGSITFWEPRGRKGPGSGARRQCVPYFAWSQLRWRFVISVPDIGPGPATVRGAFSSDCELWPGTFAASPVTMTVRASDMRGR